MNEKGGSFFLLPIKTDFSSRLDRRDHQLTDGVKDDLKLGVVFFFQIVKPAGQILVGSKHPSESYKGPHDFDVHPNGAWTVQDAGEHGDPLFRKGIGHRPADASQT